MMKMPFFVVVASVALLMSCHSPSSQSPETFQSSEHLGDADRDGVINLYDLCVNTPRRTTVDSRGCPTDIADNLTQDEFVVFFDTGSNELSETERTYLRSHTSAFTGDHVEKIYIEAFLMDEESALILRHREDAVVAALIEMGVDSRRLEVVPMGSMSDQHHADAHHANRANSRVYIVVTHQVDDPS